MIVRLLKSSGSHKAELHDLIQYKIIKLNAGADPGRGESGSSHGQIFSTLEYFALTFLKILD